MQWRNPSSWGTEAKRLMMLGVFLFTFYSFSLRKLAPLAGHPGLRDPSSCLPSLSNGVSSVCAHWGIWTKLLMLLQRDFYPLSHFPSPQSMLLLIIKTPFNCNIKNLKIKTECYIFRKELLLAVVYYLIVLYTLFTNIHTIHVYIYKY